MVRIGAHLHDSGHDVVVVTTPEYRDHVHAAGLRLEPLGADAQIDPPSPPAAVPMPKLLRRYLLGLAEMRSTFISPLRAQHETLERVLTDGPADAVLADLAFTGVLPLLLDDRPRPPILAVGVGPLTLSSADTPPFGMAWTPRPGKNYDAMTHVVQRVMLGGVQSELNHALGSLESCDLPVSLMDWPRLADRMLQLTVPAFEYPRRDLPATVEYVGPVLPDVSGDFEPPSWWDEVLAAPTVVHVTQGTFDNRDLNQLIGPTIEALAGLDVAVVATTGKPVDLNRLPGLPQNAFVADWLPYSFLLPHVSVMITNGGCGGLQHALSYGIPLIVAGETSDKAEVAARVAYTGVGINLRSSAPTPADLKDAVADILRSPRYHAAARHISREITASNALTTIDRLVAAEVSSGELRN